MNNGFIKQFIQAAKKDNRILYDPKCFGIYEDIIYKIYEDVQEFDYYTLDGRLDDILINVINNFTFDEKQNYYTQILNLIHLEFEKIVVPNIILIPLNNFRLHLDYEACYEVSENIKIFYPTNIDNYVLRNNYDITIKKDRLSEYFEQNIFATLLKNILY